MRKRRTGDTFADNAVASSFAISGDDNELLRHGIARETIVSERAQTKASEVGLIRTRLASSADGHLTRAASKLLNAPGGPTGRMSDIDYKAFSGAVDHAVRLANLDKELATLEGEYRSRVIEVKPVNPYSDGSPHSWVSDVLAASDTSGFSAGRRVDGDHEERLRRHGAIVARAVERQTKYGKAITRQYAEGFRQDDVVRNRETAEKRAQEFRTGLTSGGGATASASGGGAAAFVTPAILMDAYALYRSPYRSFADQCNDTVALPAYGLQAYVPTFTTGTTVATGTEGSGTAEGDPVTSFASGAIVQKSGQIQVSQATLDRVGPGIAGDVILFEQLKNQLGAQVDVYAITQAIANAATVTNSGAFALAGTSDVGGLFGDVKKAKSKLTDTAGIRLRATHLFAQDDLVDYVLAYADAQGRPIATPAFDDNRLPIRSVGDQFAEGYSGHVLSGLALFGDSNIPTLTTSVFDQLIVCRPDTILLLEGPSITYIRPQFQANNLEPVVGVYEYTTTIPRFPSGVATISGSAYTASTFQ